jgi:hypothetical protein
MPYNEKLAARIRKALAPQMNHVEEKKMMGGLTFMVKGKMCCGIAGDDLMVRVIDEKYAPSLRRAHCRKMDFTGKPLRGFLFVGKAGIPDARRLASWIALGVEYVESVTSREKKVKKRM